MPRVQKSSWMPTREEKMRLPQWRWGENRYSRRRRDLYTRILRAWFGLVRFIRHPVLNSRMKLWRVTTKAQTDRQNRIAAATKRLEMMGYGRSKNKK